MKTMEGFSAEFKTPEQYITDITYKIWEERGVGRIYDWYSAAAPVHTPHGTGTSVEDVVKHTFETMCEFPNREIFAEDIIIGEKSPGFYSSHRARSTAVHTGMGMFGKATDRPIYRLAIADCLCKDNQVIEEWLVVDNASSARQLGLDSAEFGRTLGLKNPALYTIGNDAMRQEWSDPNGLTIVGNTTIAQNIIDTYDAIWNNKNLSMLNTSYDRAVRHEGVSGTLCYGGERTGDLLTSVLASIPSGSFEPHHVIVREQEARPIRVALRWSYCGTFNGHGRYGEPNGAPVALLGVSHFELRDGKILNEWVVADETAIYAQIAAHNQVNQRTPARAS